MSITVIHADITTLAVDAIVNAANPTLLGGGGVDGAIHRAADPELLEACRALPEVAPGVRCPTGEARLTPGFALPAHWVIHVVGPVWEGGHGGEDELLARCYRNAVRIAWERQLTSIAFPAISCGVYGYPARAAAGIAIGTLRPLLASHDLDVTLCCFSLAMRATLQHALDASIARDGGSAH